MAGNRYVDTSPRARETAPFHTSSVHVMETLGEPQTPYFRYEVGMYVYLHDHAYEVNPLAARECMVEDVVNAPLEIIVRPCNSDELITVAQDRLSAPIRV